MFSIYGILGVLRSIQEVLRSSCTEVPILRSTLKYRTHTLSLQMVTVLRTTTSMKSQSEFVNRLKMNLFPTNLLILDSKNEPIYY
jgi:hypothetical protein